MFKRSCVALSLHFIVALCLYSFRNQLITPTFKKRVVSFLDFERRQGQINGNRSAKENNDTQIKRDGVVVMTTSIDTKRVHHDGIFTTLFNKTKRAERMISKQKMFWWRFSLTAVKHGALFFYF